ncbi:isochorismatase family protein [Haloferax sp. MBLA0076]|uniref:Isochorismatase family protein n=1 Tax=Haloferax litoreum TaxID=2666140 RepID=A0A6A8GF42_9EURY|nr:MULTISPECIES: isochorismatase family cysteine hydrolase [Haloferax]KAB1193028.1 cysteine hydrolase [Haloferax sp. CBA1148]MRX21519.1 isochorismatase family protein [Haloferax litoreum]
MALDPTRTAVVVVDMQNGFCHPDGCLFSPASDAAVEAVTDLVSTAREAGARIVYTRDVHPPEQFDDAHYYDEFDRWGEHVVEGTWDAELLDALDVRDGDLVVEKHTYDAFYQTQLEGWLDSHGVDDLLICGTLANVCVLHTAGSAGLRDYRPILVTDALGYIEQSHKEYAVDHADWLFGETTTLGEIEFE